MKYVNRCAENNRSYLLIYKFMVFVSISTDFQMLEVDAASNLETIFFSVLQ